MPCNHFHVLVRVLGLKEALAVLICLQVVYLKGKAQCVRSSTIRNPGYLALVPTLNRSKQILSAY